MPAAEYIWQLHCQDHAVYYDGTVYPALKTADGTPPASVCPVTPTDTVDMPVKLLKIFGTELAPTSNLDLSEGMLTIPQGTSFPSSPVKGDLFHRNDEDKVYCYSGSVWHVAGKGTAHGDLVDIGSNTHAQVDSHIGSSANPHTVTKAQVNLTNVEDLKVNLAASVDPVATDDSGSGYAIGSRWVNTSTNKEFVCTDATPTAAVWLETTLIAMPFSRGGVILEPSGVINIMSWRVPFACTVTNVRGYRVDGTGATINARKNGSLNHLSSALSLTSADTWMDGGAVQNTAYAAGDSMEIMLVSIAGTPTQIVIQVDLIRP